MKEHILAFGCEGIAPLLTQTFAPRKMAVKAVLLADYAQTVGALAGAADCPRTEEVYAGPPLAEPMLVFCGAELFAELQKEHAAMTAKR